MSDLTPKQIFQQLLIQDGGEPKKQFFKRFTTILESVGDRLYKESYQVSYKTKFSEENETVLKEIKDKLYSVIEHDYGVSSSFGFYDYLLSFKEHTSTEFSFIYVTMVGESISSMKSSNGAIHVSDTGLKDVHLGLSYVSSSNIHTVEIVPTMIGIMRPVIETSYQPQTKS